MAWEDRTPFEAIFFQFQLLEKEVIKIMRKNLKESSFNRWRKRLNSAVSQKHQKKRNPLVKNFETFLARKICSRRKIYKNIFILHLKLASNSF